VSLPRSLRAGLKALGLALLLLPAFMLINTFRRGAPGVPVGQASAAAPDDPRPAAEHLAQAIRFQTVSHEDPRDDDYAHLDGLRAYLEKTYRLTHIVLGREMINGHALLYTWKGKDPALSPALFAAHLDVVPVEPSTQAQWSHPPFAGTLADGFLWGRGAMDDKASVITLLEAVESLLKEDYEPSRTTYLAFGFDEEVGGSKGAREIANVLASRGIRLDFVLDEGAAVTEGLIPGVARQVAMIGLTEKGYLSVELRSHVPAGHSAMPPPHTAVGVLAAALDRLESHQMRAHLVGAARRQFELLAPQMPFLQRMAMSNLWLLEPLVLRALASQPIGNAMVRTTTASTMFSGGIKDNVLPSEARATVNFRILPGDTIDTVLGHVKEVIDDERITVTTLQRLVTNPPPEAPTNSHAYRLLEGSIHQHFPSALVTPTLVVGGTDAREYARLAKGVYHFVPFVLHPDDRLRVHGTDERIPIEALSTMVAVYRHLLRDIE